MPFRPSLQPLSFPQTTTVIHISVLWVHLHFLEFYIHGTICYVLSCFSHVWLCAILWTVACQSLLCPRNFPGKNTGVGCHFLLQGIIPTWRSNPTSPALAGRFLFFFFLTTNANWEAQESYSIHFFGLASFTQHNHFKIHLCFCMHQ